MKAKLVKESLNDKQYNDILNDTIELLMSNNLTRDFSYEYVNPKVITFEGESISPLSGYYDDETQYANYSGIMSVKKNGIEVKIERGKQYYDDQEREDFSGTTMLFETPEEVESYFEDLAQ